MFHLELYLLFYSQSFVRVSAVVCLSLLATIVVVVLVFFLYFHSRIKDCYPYLSRIPFPGIICRMLAKFQAIPKIVESSNVTDF